MGGGVAADPPDLSLFFEFNSFLDLQNTAFAHLRGKDHPGLQCQSARHILGNLFTLIRKTSEVPVVQEGPDAAEC